MLAIRGVRYCLDGWFDPPLNPRQLFMYLEEVVPLVGMTLVKGPFIEPHGHELTGYVLIAESHIMVHQWWREEKWVGTVDLNTCNAAALDKKLFLGYTVEKLGFRLDKKPWELDWVVG
jgi:S-adenosylmethionine/arginine decarboxylase-like enzyme